MKIHGLHLTKEEYRATVISNQLFSSADVSFQIMEKPNYRQEEVDSSFSLLVACMPAIQELDRTKSRFVKNEQSCFLFIKHNLCVLTRE